MIERICGEKKKKKVFEGFMSFEDHFSRANALFVDEDFDAALKEYNAAAEASNSVSASQKAELFVKRSAW